MERRYLQPAMVGGLVIGVLSALPIVAAGNICCCLWVVAGGVTAAYLLQQAQAQPVTAGDGAFVGLVAGGIGAVCYLVISIPVTIVISPIEREILRRLAESGGNVPPEVRDYVDGSAGTAARVVLGFLFMLFASPAFATLGGLLGAALFRKAPAAPPAPPGAPVPHAAGGAGPSIHPLDSGGGGTGSAPPPSE